MTTRSPHCGHSRVGPLPAASAAMPMKIAKPHRAKESGVGSMGAMVPGRARDRDGDDTEIDPEAERFRRSPARFRVSREAETAVGAFAHRLPERSLHAIGALSTLRRVGIGVAQAGWSHCLDEAAV